MLRAGRCRSCGCTHFRPCPNGCGWSDNTHTHCTACFCALCGEKFLRHQQYRFDPFGDKVCKNGKACLARATKKRAVAAGGAHA